MSKFTQLVNEFDIQEWNWIRYAGGDSYLNHLFWNGCMTGRLQDSAIQLSESASDTRDGIATLDGFEFNKLVMWLPRLHQRVYLAYIFNKVSINSEKVKYTKAGDKHHQCQLLGITKYRYDQLLDMAIKMIKRKGGFE